MTDTYGWHYATRIQFNWAMRTGRLMSPLRLVGQRRPITLFTAEPVWQPTLMVGPPARCVLQAEGRRIGGLYRFGYPMRLLTRTFALASPDTVPPAILSAIYTAVEAAGADATGWIAVVEPLPFFEMVMEREVSGRWSSIRQVALSRDGGVEVVDAGQEGALS